jgi:hypothetical protein
VKQIELDVAGCEFSAATARAIEAVMNEQGLERSLKCSLRAYPGCVHWHFRKPHETGTLEVTMWPARRRVWLSVQSGRRAAWISRSLKKIKMSLQRELAR